MNDEKKTKGSDGRNLSESRKLAEDIFKDALGEMKAAALTRGKAPAQSPPSNDRKARTQGDPSTSSSVSGAEDREKGPQEPDKARTERAEERKKRAPEQTRAKIVPSEGREKRPPDKAKDQEARAEGRKKGPPQPAEERQAAPVKSPQPVRRPRILIIGLAVVVAASLAGTGIYLSGVVDFGLKGPPAVSVAPERIEPVPEASQAVVSGKVVSVPPARQEAAKVPLTRVRKVVKPDPPVADKALVKLSPPPVKGTADMPKPGRRDSGEEQNVEEGAPRPPGPVSPGPSPDRKAVVAEKPVASYPFSIQMYSMSTREGADKAVEEYREKGLDTYWVKVDLGRKGVWFRVFVGNFKDREKAEQFMTEKGLSGATVNRMRYAVLAGTHSSNEEMRRNLKALSGLGFSPYVISGDNGEFMIYVGAFYSRKGAELQSRELSSKGIPGRVVER
jgi:sporulation related protein